MTGRRILPPTYFLAAIVLMAALHWSAPVVSVIATPWNLVGILPLALGVVLNLMADRAFAKHQTTVKPFEQPRVLVTSGVFRFSRHPMYLGMVLMLIGIALLMGSLSPFLIVGVFALLVDRLFITAEGAMLSATFGEDWANYKRSVRRWL